MKLSNVEQLYQFGYTVITNAYSKSEIESITNALSRLVDVHESYVWHDCLDVEETWQYACNPKVLDIIHILLGEVNIGNYFVKGLKQVPGLKQTKGLSPHNDYLQHFPRGVPGIPFGLSIMICLTEFTKGNGATCILPCSHLAGFSHKGKRFTTNDELEKLELPFFDLVPIEVERGSIILWDTRIIHMQPLALDESSIRLAMNVMYFAKWFDLRLEREWPQISKSMFDEMPPELQNMLAFRKAEVA